MEKAGQLAEAPQLLHLESEANPLVRLHNHENVSKCLVVSSVIFMTCKLGRSARNLRAVWFVTARELNLKAIF